MATFRCKRPGASGLGPSVILAWLFACHHAPQPPLVPLAPAAYSHYLAGKLALYHDDAATAAAELAQAAAAAPDQAMIAVEQGRALAKAHHIDQAEQVLAVARMKWPAQA